MHDQIRPADADDLPVLRAIQTATLAEPWPEMLALGADGPPLLLVYADPDVVGYALAILGDSDHPASAGGGPDGSMTVDSADDDCTEASGSDPTDEEGAAYLVELAVAPTRQSEGIGTALVEAVLTRLRGEGYDRLEVTAREADDGALVFYRRCGFEEVARLPDHYDSGDGVLLRRTVDRS
jgi:ribosomal-protein-alanine N-acetyltransferase